MKGKIVIVTIALIAVIMIINTTRSIIQKEEEKEANAVHAIVIAEDANMQKKPKENSKSIKTLKAGDNVLILEEKDNWYRVKNEDKKGYIYKEQVDYYEENNNEKVLMSDVSKFNIQNKDFESAQEYEKFLIENDIQYVYIRIGGRGYGEEGILYKDQECDTFIEACEYLKIPYGFYFIEEAVNKEEIEEEVEYIKSIINEKAKENYKLPLTIDIEKFDVKARTDEIWEQRADLINYMVQIFKKDKIDTLVYSNAKIANEYLSSVDNEFWISYYDENKEIPWIWFSETDQEAAQNEELMDKTVAWQFTQSGAGEEIQEKVDLSIVKNKYFSKYRK